MTAVIGSAETETNGMRVGIIANKAKVTDAGVIAGLAKYLRDRGYETVVFGTNEQIDGTDVVIVLGGDGAILHAAVVAARKNIKVIGINYGTLGFLTEYEKEETERVAELLEKLRGGDCQVLRRTMLELRVDGKSYYGLNEVAFQRDYAGASQIVRLEVFRNGKESGEFVGDGILLSTPTGSTAYALSAGGALLIPEVPVFMITPVCAFSLNTRAVVFPDTDKFYVKVTKGRVLLLIDGKQVSTLEKEMSAEIVKAPFTADFPVTGDACFLKKLRAKLNQ